MNEANPKLSSTTAGISYSLNVVLYVIVQLLLSVIIGVAGLKEGSDGYLYISYLAAPLALATGGIAIILINKQKFGEVVPVKCHFKYYIIALLMIFGLLFAVSNLNVLTLKLLQIMGYTPREQNSYVPSLNGWRIVPALLVIAVIPAVFEEFFFRGVLLNNARASMGDIWIIFVVGFCFALFHGSPEQTVYQFITGCAFAFLAVRAGSLLPCVLMHFINNALIIIFYKTGVTDAGGNLAITFGWNIALIVIAAVAFAGSIIWLILDKKPLKRGGKFGLISFFIFASVGIIILSVVWIYSFFAR